MKRLLVWLVSLLTTASLLLGLAPPAAAQSSSDFTHGVAVSGSEATIWFKSNVATTWVDVHYQLNNGPQQNLRMSWNPGTARYEQKVLEPVAVGHQVGYWFTYNNGNPAYDSARFTFAVGSMATVATPTFTPPGGTYGSAQSVTIATATPGATIKYTTDGSTPTAGSATYTGPVSVTTSRTLRAFALKSGMNDSAVAGSTYTINSTLPTAATPTFSPAPGTFTSAQSVTLATTTAGAAIRYTLDGSTPTASSALYSGAIAVASTKTIKAIALRSGYNNSAVASGTFTIDAGASWNALTTFKMENATNGRWRDDQVYWAIIGKSWQTGEFVHVDINGNIVPMKLADNTVPKNGRLYANYFYNLAQTKSITIPALDSARILMSVGSPMYIEVNTDGAGRVAYAGANIENASDPNLDVIFDFGEFAIQPKGHPQQGVWVNTTRVDQFGFPLKLRVQGLGGYDKTVGEPLTETRDQLFAKYAAEVPVEFRSLADPNFPNVPAKTRIIAPAHHTFRNDGVNASYLDPYTGEMWNKFKSQDLVFTLDNLGTFRGRVDASTNRFVFTGGNWNGTYYINGQPNTAEVLLGAGKLDDPRKPDGSFQVDVGGGHPAKSIQLQIQAQVCAALNRHVLDAPANWYKPSAFYPAGTRANWFAKFWHDHSIKGTEGNAAGYGLAYGFAYDDVGHFSPSLHSNAPTTVTYTIGW